MTSPEPLLYSDNQLTPSCSEDWYNWCEQTEDFNFISNEPWLPGTADLVHPPTQQAAQPDALQPEVHQIPIITGNRPTQPEPGARPPSSRITIRRNNKAVTALSLPNLWGANHRSLWPRLENMLDELVELQAHVGFHCEVWETRKIRTMHLRLRKHMN